MKMKRVLYVIYYVCFSSSISSFCLHPAVKAEEPTTITMYQIRHHLIILDQLLAKVNEACSDLNLKLEIRYLGWGEY